MGNQTTWNPAGAKQVSTTGKEEKRAFTLIPTISVSRKLLLMHAIYFGKGSGSLPNAEASSYVEAMHLGFKLKPSKSV
jgi:hypothetical protein